jgi:hypothetical protein
MIYLQNKLFNLFIFFYVLFLSAHEYAVKYIETKQLPSNWNDDGPDEILKNESSDHSSSTEAESDGDENDRNEFLEKLNKFLGEKGEWVTHEMLV